jgi:hypothetical protein
VEEYVRVQKHAARSKERRGTSRNTDEDENVSAIKPASMTYPKQPAKTSTNSSFSLRSSQDDSNANEYSQESSKFSQDY